jgi:hypothetical protein
MIPAPIQPMAGCVNVSDGAEDDMASRIAGVWAHAPTKAERSEA